MVDVSSERDLISISLPSISVDLYDAGTARAEKYWLVENVGGVGGTSETGGKCRAEGLEVARHPAGGKNICVALLLRK